MIQLEKLMSRSEKISNRLINFQREGSEEARGDDPSLILMLYAAFLKLMNQVGHLIAGI